MLAVVKYGQQPREVELREVPVPEIGETDVLLEVKAAGVCGSDIEFWQHSITFPVNTPVIQGHEFAGVIARVGGRVSGWREGDEVVSETAAYICGRCRLCRAGQYNLCPERLGYGYGTDGAFTRYVRVPERILHRKPPEVSWTAAALTEPACVAYNALVVQSDLRPGEPVVILGPGPIGLFCLQVAKAMSASPVIVTGASVDAERLALARALGADIAVNAEAEDPMPVVLEATQGEGVPLVVDAVGHPATVAQSLAMVARNGEVIKLGWGPQPLGFSLDPVTAKAVRYQGSFSHTWRTWEAVLEMSRTGTLRPEALITHEMGLREWLRAYELVHAREAVKVILRPE